MGKLHKLPYAKLALMLLTWRTLLFVVAYIAPKFIQPFGNKFPYVGLLIDSKLPHFLWSFGNFDGVHYLGITQHLYAYQYTQAFFPLYPIIIKFATYLTLGNYVLAGLIVSNLAFAAGLVVFYELIKKLHSENTAFWACLFMLSFPTSFYFGSIYTEGVFFLLIISSFYLLAENKLLAASVIGAFASSTRLIGVFLAPAFIKGRKFSQIAPLFIIPVGLLLYMSYLYFKFHNAFYFLTAQTIFGQERSTASIIILPQVFYRYIKILLTTHGLVLATASFELICTLFAIIILILATKKAKREWLIFSWLAILVPTLTGTFTSMPRYILVAFPIFVYLALINNVYVKLIIVAVFLSLLAVTTALFTQGYWVA